SMREIVGGAPRTIYAHRAPSKVLGAGKQLAVAGKYAVARSDQHEGDTEMRVASRQTSKGEETIAIAAFDQVEDAAQGMQLDPALVLQAFAYRLYHLDQRPGRSAGLVAARRIRRRVGEGRKIFGDEAQLGCHRQAGLQSQADKQQAKGCTHGHPLSSDGRIVDGIVLSSCPRAERDSTVQG